MKPAEECFLCNAYTGKAGAGDGSLYCNCGTGPYCEECWSHHMEVCDDADA